MTPATSIRHRIIGVSMLMAFILYLDRICMGEIVKSVTFHQDLRLTKEEIGRILGAFYFSYAIFQVPAGWLSDRFGARAALTSFIVLWSIFTAATGWMQTFTGLLVMRLLCGMAEAGAYPTCQAVIRLWMPVTARARASALVSLGGRIGGTLAPALTAWMILALGSWRQSLFLDGALGLVIAGIYWYTVRSRPQEHPGVNAAELALIGNPPGEAPFSAPELKQALWIFARNRSLWCNSLNGLLVNVGWTFLVTWLPTYLVEEKGVGQLEGGQLVTYALAAGMLGQLVGGAACDWSTRRWGLRWGRIAPNLAGCALAAVAYLICPFIESVWALIACCAMVSFAVDAANPATWAFIGDVGGRATAALGGWVNMWGNLGSSASALLIPWLLSYGGSGESGKRIVFFTLAGSFILAGLAALGTDASRRLVPDRVSES